jgi:hypothetical protein
MTDWFQLAYGPWEESNISNTIKRVEYLNHLINFQFLKECAAWSCYFIVLKRERFVNLTSLIPSIRGLMSGVNCEQESAHIDLNLTLAYCNVPHHGM